MGKLQSDLVVIEENAYFWKLSPYTLMELSSEFKFRLDVLHVVDYWYGNINYLVAGNQLIVRIAHCENRIRYSTNRLASGNPRTRQTLDQEGCKKICHQHF